MNASRMANNIRRLRRMLKEQRVVAAHTLWTMDQVASSVESYLPDEEWELLIDPNRPVEFVQAETDERLKPDIFCCIRSSAGDELPVSHLRLVLRIWSVKSDISFRADWDSDQIREKLERTGSSDRVVFRCHYDSRSPNQYAPVFHLQFGGDPSEGELCWFPHYLELPRFASPPIDLILACELVVTTFFPSAHRKLKQNGTWTSLVQESEYHFMSGFYRMCKSYFDFRPQYQTLLDRLCSSIS